MIQTEKNITFIIEDLKRPDKLVPAYPYSKIIKRLIETQHETELIIDSYSIELENNSDYDYGIVAHNKISENLVNLSYHSFFHGLYNAYAEHRPFVLSPDIIWLLIIQGFSYHIEFNSEKLRDKFVDFDKKITLTIKDERLVLEDEKSPWNEIFPQFSSKIADVFGEEFVNTITADYSTTGENELIASQITLMHSVKSFVEYLAFGAICGIPEITIEGETQDWENLIEKTDKLRGYELNWWVKELKPILKEFVNTSKGKINNKFWRNIIKQKWDGCGEDEIFNGWIVKFFPYDKDGKRLSLQKIDNRHNLPNEIVKVPFKYIENGKSYNLEAWSGFIGLQQNEETFALKPQIGWLIRKNNPNEIQEGLNKNLNGMDEIVIRVKTIPNEILELEKIDRLSILFVGEINIPEKLYSIPIKELSLYGKIGNNDILNICKRFQKTDIIINDVYYKKGIIGFIVGKLRLRELYWRFRLKLQR